jgi:hypothetical protein
VREALFWISGAALAFLLTAGAFLALANLGAGPAEKSIEPSSQRAEQGTGLVMSVSEGDLATLEARPGQNLDLRIENTGDRSLSGANLTVEIYSENTALSDARRNRETIQGLPAGESVTVTLALNLTPPAGATIPDTPEPARTIVEIRATAPEGASAVKTLILPL